MKKRIAGFIVVVVCAVCILSACSGGTPFVVSGVDKIDLTQAPDGLPSEFRYLYETTVVDDSKDYLAHPDAILRKDGSILAMYPAGHGKGAVQTRVSTNGGLTWENNPDATPASWEGSNETPTVFRLTFTNGTEKLLMVSANPKWTAVTGDGFHASVSADEGKTWTEFEKFYGKKSSKHVSPIVAMASLVRIKENGAFADKWMGIFHDHNFVNYKTYLTFDAAGHMQWSEPVAYFSAYEKTEKESNMCEVMMIRSDGGVGDELCLITRSNTKKMNSLISFSQDEGETWSEPKEVNSALNGERHKAVLLPDGRLFVTFRSIERDEKYKEYRAKSSQKWYSEGWVAWVGTYADLKNGADGQYRIRLAHTYLDGQNPPSANADTGYCGNVLMPNGTIVTMSYGRFSPEDKTYIVSKRISLADIDALFEYLNP